MAENIVNSIIQTFNNFTNIPFGKEIIIFIVSLLPIVELRGGLIAASILGVNPYIGFLICFIGNILPVPIILWFIMPLFNRLKKFKSFQKMIEKLEKKALKNKDKIEKYEFWSLLLFVGIPLPGTGAWTGSLVASILDMDKKKALIAIICGVFMAGCIMLILSYGILPNIFKPIN